MVWVLQTSGFGIFHLCVNILNWFEIRLQEKS